MAKSGKPWYICDDCLDPLARKLVSIAQRLGHSFDVEKAIRLDTEYRQIEKDSNYCDTRLTDAQRKRQDELNEQMRAQIKPPRARDIEYLYQDYRITTAIEWLKFYVSVEYADSFEHTLFDATKRFFDLEFKACQIINHDEGKESMIRVRYPIQRLIDRHYKLLRDLYPEHEHHPDRDELPEHLRAFEVEIMEEYDKTKKQIREVPKYLQQVSALVRSKMKKADVKFDRVEAKKNLTQQESRAFLYYELAEKEAGKRLKDREAYDLLKENGISGEGAEESELSDNELPAFDTWSRYLRSARKKRGQQKNNRRSGRTTGRSVVRHDEI